MFGGAVFGDSPRLGYTGQRYRVEAIITWVAGGLAVRELVA
jgi:uncharacterized protein (DUF433 family)